MNETEKQYFNILMCRGVFRHTAEIYTKCKAELSDIKSSCAFDLQYKEIILNLIDNTIYHYTSTNDEIKAVIDTALEFFPQYTQYYAKAVEKWNVILTSIECKLNEF